MLSILTMMISMWRCFGANMAVNSAAVANVAVNYAGI